MDGDAERTSTQNFLEVLTEASAFQRIEMALKPQNDRDMKGLEGSNLPLYHTVWHASLHHGEAMKSARGARFTRGRGRGECQRQRLSVKIA